MILGPLPLQYPAPSECLTEEIAAPSPHAAPWLDAVAKWTCVRSGASSCDWYHGAWQYLRLLDLVSTPWWHASFFRNAIAEQSAVRAEPRVLISGCADHSTYALVHSRLADSGVVTALDLCPTPLIGTFWYARHIGAPVPELLVADAIEHERPRFYDIIVSDSFLPRFPIGKLRKLLLTWYRSLSPEGVVLTTVRLHQAGSNPNPPNTPRLSGWHQVAADAQSWWPEFSGLPYDDLIRRISVFVTKQERSAFFDVSTLSALFVEAGFEHSTITTRHYRNREFALVTAYRGPI